MDSCSQRQLAMSVGSPFPGGPLPCPSLGFHPSSQLVILVADGLSDDEIYAFRKAEVRLGVYFHRRITGIVFRITGFNRTVWMDAPWGWTESVPPPDPCPPEGLTDQSRLILTFVLVDERNVVRASRAGTLSPEVTRLLVARLEDSRRDGPLARDEYLREVDDLYRRFPRSVDAHRAALGRCRLGD